MAVNVYIPTPYRQYTGNRAHVQLEAATVADALHQLTSAFPELADRVFDAGGALKPYLNVFVNEEEIRSLSGLDTTLRDGDQVALIPAMAGGVSATEPPALTEQQLERYSRQIILPEVGIEGQKRLLQKRVLIIGAGGLGSPAAVYLAAAGVGTIGIVDADRVDITNLHRQILHDTDAVGEAKTASARRRLAAMNPELAIIEHDVVLTSANALPILRDYDLIINGSDNFPTRYLVNDACVLLNKPLVDASILRFEGQMTAFVPGKGCYRCLFPSPPPPGSVPSCAEAGIIGALAGHMGTLQAIEAIKLLLGIGEPMTNRLLIYDALAAQYRMLRWQRDPACPVCGDRPTIRALIDYEAFCGVPLPQQPDRREALAEAGASASEQAGAQSGSQLFQRPPQPQAQPQAPLPASSFSVEQLAARRDPVVRCEELVALLAAGEVDLVDVREPHEFRQMRIAQATSIPLSQLPSRITELQPDRPTVFVCMVGERSNQAVTALRRAGFRQTYNLQGGMIGWLNHNLPVESDGL